MLKSHVLLAVLLISLSAFAAPRLRDATDEGLCFPVNVGTKWLYDSSTGEYEETITESKADGKATIVTVVRTEGQKETWVSTYRVTHGRLEMLASGGVTYENPLTQLRAGAKPGDEWEFTATRDMSRHHHRYKVIGREPVETVAGAFTAIRLDVAERYQRVGAAPADGPPTECSVWYAPGVGMVKRVRLGQETTLKNFTPGK